MHTVSRRPLDQINTEWRATARTAQSRAALRRLAAAEPAVAALGVADLGELVEAIGRPSGTAGRDEAARVLQAMLRSQGVHTLVPRAVLQAILPGLVTVARRLSWGSGGDWDGGASFFADVMTTAWEVIVEWSGQDRPYAVLDLLSAVRCRLRRQMLRASEGRRRLDWGVDLDSVPTCPGTRDPSELDQLARAIVGLRGRGLEPLDSAILYGSCVLGFSITEMARLTGRSRRFVGQRRNRAARELLA
jgi:hypothetical protein